MHRIVNSVSPPSGFVSLGGGGDSNFKYSWFVVLYSDSINCVLFLK